MYYNDICLLEYLCTEDPLAQDLDIKAVLRVLRTESSRREKT